MELEITKDGDKSRLRIRRNKEIICVRYIQNKILDLIREDAKKEVFDDIEKRLLYCLTEQHEDTLFPLAGQEHRNEIIEVFKDKVLDFIKQRHLTQSIEEANKE